MILWGDGDENDARVDEVLEYDDSVERGGEHYGQGTTEGSILTTWQHLGGTL